MTMIVLLIMIVNNQRLPMTAAAAAAATQQQQLAVPTPDMFLLAGISALFSVLTELYMLYII